MITNKPDIVTVIENEGYEINNDVMLCPFHAEKHPSFKIYPEQNSFYCFGCNVSGDSITFIQKSKNLSFQEALKYLGISGKPYKPNLKEIKRSELLQNFRQWEKEYFDDLCSLYRTLQKAKEKAKTIEEVEALAEFYHQERIWLHRIEILQSSDDVKKFELYQEVMKNE